MASLLALIALGFILGMRHATDPDHVIAVTTIVTRQRSLRRAVMIGVWWGLGHTLTIFTVGAGIIVFGMVIPPRVGLTMELAVGLMLILLGMLNLSGALVWAQRRLRIIPAAAGDTLMPGALERDPLARTSLRRWRAGGEASPWRPLAVGLVHGLAGSAAVALLVLAAIRDPLWAMGYLLLFGIGTIAGMMAITLGLASTFGYAGERWHWLRLNLNLLSGLLSAGFGLLIAYQIGFAAGLFTGHPHWTPR